MSRSTDLIRINQCQVFSYVCALHVTRKRTKQSNQYCQSINICTGIEEILYVLPDPADGHKLGQLHCSEAKTKRLRT